LFVLVTVKVAFSERACTARVGCKASVMAYKSANTKLQVKARRLK
jgi:hypothetical protein